MTNRRGKLDGNGKFFPLSAKPVARLASTAQFAQRITLMPQQLSVGLEDAEISPITSGICSLTWGINS